MTKEEIIERADNQEPFWGLYWDGRSLTKHKVYETTDEDDERGYICVTMGHGDYEWYKLEDYGKKWAFNLQEMEESIGMLGVKINADIKAWDKREAVKEAYEQGKEEAERHLQQEDIINIVEGVAQILVERQDRYVSEQQKCSSCNYRECRGLVENQTYFPCDKCCNNYGSMWQPR